MILSEELSRRKPVWLALSEFYLDTELDSKDLKRIAQIFQTSGYSLNELKRINYEEVAPVVSPNLMSTAGVWSGFDKEWLETEIIKKSSTPSYKSIFNKLYLWYIDWMTGSYWKTIEAMLLVSDQD